jgi:hypothetical protein
MAAKWGPEVSDAIWTLRCDGIMPTEITERLNAGDELLNGVPQPIPLATVRWKLERLIEERGRPEANIAPGTELSIANAEQRKILTWARARRREITEGDEAGPNDVLTMTRLSTLISSCETSIRAARQQKDPRKVAEGLQPKGVRSDTLRRIADDERARKRAAGDDPPPDVESTPERRMPDTPGPYGDPL